MSETKAFAMRLALIAILVAGLGLSACADPKPPVGRWQGDFAGNDVMIVARVEILANGMVRASAPDALADFPSLSADEIEATHAKLLAGLEMAWPNVAARTFHFDGKIFRKPEGVAPQMEWDDKTKKLTLIVYLGTQPSVRVTMEPVAAFD